MEETYTYYFTASSEQLDEVQWMPLSQSLGHTEPRPTELEQGHSLSERSRDHPI